MLVRHGGGDERRSAFRYGRRRRRIIRRARLERPLLAHARDLFRVTGRETCGGRGDRIRVAPCRGREQIKTRRFPTRGIVKVWIEQVKPTAVEGSDP